MNVRRGLFWPLVLITNGLVFLLVNYGLVPGVTALSLLSLWPLLLILGGVDIAIGRRWPLAALGIDVAVIALGLVLLSTQPTILGSPFPIFGGSSGGERDVSVDRQSVTAMSLVINGGAGEFFIDLSDVKVTSAELNVGAASLTLTLPKPTGTVNVDVNAGASSIVIEVPEGVEARVTTTGLVLTLRSSNPRVTASGNSAETSGYGTATARVTVHVTAGASSIAIR